MLSLLAASLFFTTPFPLDMPRAEAYLVKEDGRLRLEDRFNIHDLWLSRTVEGRWMDDEGRVLILSELDVVPPPLTEAETVTRVDYASSCVPLDRKDFRNLRDAVSRLSSVEIVEKSVPPRQMCRGYADIGYWQGTNMETIVCAVRPEKSETWYLATWRLVEGDAFDESLKLFEDEFLAKDLRTFLAANPPRTVRHGPRRRLPSSERELLRADARHSVSNYPSWHATDSDEFTVLDDLPARRDFIVALTNELKACRGRYAAAVPSPLDGKDVLCVARIYASRDEYLAAVGEEMSWSAAYWSPLRRELVAYLPEGGFADLLRTIRHEAFHQYLSYAASMIPASPWFNEGYAEYFEDPDGWDWGFEADFETLSEAIPAVLKMDYAAFYAGTDQERKVKYRLAESIAYFIENGIDKIRFEPFKTLKADYMNALVETKDMVKATESAFGTVDRLALFVAEWKKFWKNR